MKTIEKEKARRGRALEFDEIDESFMKDYGILPEQMRFFKAAYRREKSFKITIGLLLAALIISYAIYFAVR